MIETTLYPSLQTSLSLSTGGIYISKMLNLIQNVVDNRKCCIHPDLGIDFCYITITLAETSLDQINQNITTNAYFIKEFNSLLNGLVFKHFMLRIGFKFKIVILFCITG